MLASGKVEKLSRSIKDLEEKISKTESEMGKAHLKKMLNSINSNINNIEDILFKFNLEN